MQKYQSNIDEFKATFKKYAAFDGRASVHEYWNFVIFNFLILLVLSILQGILGLSQNGEGLFTFIYQLVIMIPSIAVGIRRMHDINKSGWYILIPIYNLILTFQEGDKSKNQYGAAPKKPTTKKKGAL